MTYYPNYLIHYLPNYLSLWINVTEVSDGSGLLNRSFWFNVTEISMSPGYFLLSWSVEATEISWVLRYSLAKRNSDEIAPIRRGRQDVFCTAKSTTCLTNPANIFGNPKPGFSSKSGYRLKGIFAVIPGGETGWPKYQIHSVTATELPIFRKLRVTEITGYSNWAITDYITEVFRYLHNQVL